MSADNLMVSTWKISGVKNTLLALQTSELISDEIQNIFFILANELDDALEILQSD